MILSQNKQPIRLYSGQVGFTMIQLIITLAILLVLAAAVFTWIDPLARIGEAKNKRRMQDINIISAAITDYASEHKGVLPVLGSVDTNKKVLCSSQSGSNLSCAGDSQLCLTIDDDFYKYMGRLSYDPDKSSTSDTGYYLQKDANDNLIVGSCATYNSEEIIKKPSLKVSCSVYGGGYCWYLGATPNVDCDTVCVANNKNCVKNVMYGPDVNASDTAFCGINKALGNTCGTSCTNATTSTPPYASSDGTDCAVQRTTVTCYQTPGTSQYAICACD